jgi:hypothetical protein
MADLTQTGLVLWVDSMTAFVGTDLKEGTLKGVSGDAF